jgi:hypothetical protein
VTAAARVGSPLAKIVAVVEIKNDGGRRTELIKGYIELSQAERDPTLVVSGTNARMRRCAR